MNALVWRLYMQVKEVPQNSKTTALSIWRGRSMCPHCRHTLQPADLIPVFSWLLLKGKCRYCKKLVATQYPLVEVLVASLFIGSYVWWPYGWESLGIAQFVVWLAGIVVLVALAVYDLKWMLLPNKLVAVFSGFAALSVGLQVVAGEPAQVLMSAFWGVVCLSGLFYLLFQVSSGKWIGGGDVKLGVGMGMLVGGPLPALLVLFLASLLGSVVALPDLLRHRKTAVSKVPFGPYLIAATMVVYLFGARFIAWYKDRLLLGS